jgi:hypothetical protein
MLYPSTTSLTPASDSTAQNLARLINQNAEQENRRPKLVALSDQTEIQKLGESDMEISDTDSETATIVVKKEDEPIIFKKKSIDPLLSPEPTEFSGVVPKPLPDAESLVTSADHAEPERTDHPHLSDEQGDVHTMLLNSLYRSMGTVNRQLTIVNLYWTYLLQETKVFTPPSLT